MLNSVVRWGSEERECLKLPGSRLRSAGYGIERSVVTKLWWGWTDTLPLYIVFRNLRTLLCLLVSSTLSLAPAGAIIVCGYFVVQCYLGKSSIFGIVSNRTEN